MNYKRIISICLILLLLIATTGCNNDTLVEEKVDNNIEQDIDYIASEGGEMTIPLTNLNTLNPLMTENISYYHFSKLIFESIFELDNELNIIPQLAESYSISTDGKIISIRLKRDVRWHDGISFTTGDVGFTIDTLKYAKSESAYNDMFKSSQGVFSNDDISKIINYKIIDDYNIDISFERQFSSNLELLTFPIIPKHIFDIGKNGYAKALEIDNYTPIGTGPYKYISYEKFKTIGLIANQDYRDGKPYILNINGKILEDEKLILTAFETGQLSTATALGVDWDKYKSNNRINAIEYISNDYEFVAFNFKKEIFQGDKGLAIRKAINYGIDRQAIIRKAYLGHATQVDVPINPSSWLISPDAFSYGYNVEVAQEILTNAGWIDRDQDGVLEDENGEKLSLKILTNSYNQLRLKTTEMIIEDLRKLGFEIEKGYDDITVDNLTDEQISTQWDEIDTTIHTGNYDMAVLGWEMSIIPELSFIFHSSNVTNGNFMKYSNETMDELLQGVFESGSRDEILESYAKLQKFIVEDLPYVSLFYKNKALLVDSKIKENLEINFFNPYGTLKDCFIQED